MKITKQQLTQLIKEELEKTLSEEYSYMVDDEYYPDGAQVPPYHVRGSDGTQSNPDWGWEVQSRMPWSPQGGHSGESEGPLDPQYDTDPGARGEVLVYPHPGAPAPGMANIPPANREFTDFILKMIMDQGLNIPPT
jgi:hypothetical protein